MFDDVFGLILVLLVVIVGGWVLGIVGFVRAGRALRELAALRQAGGVSSAPASSHTPAVIWAPAPAPPALAPLALAPLEPALPDAPALPTPPPAPLPVQARPPARRFDVEELLTARWGVWLGSAALLLAGVFLVRTAVEEGWFGPAVRCVALGLLGTALIAAGLWLARRPVQPKNLPFPDQVPGALAAGGVVMLFGGAYAAGALYELVPPLAGFVLMAGASLVGLLASLRLGPLVAAIGIVGAFATPALVQTDAPSLPGLFAYLLFVAAAALATVRFSAWVWLGWATTIAGAAWVALVAVSAPTDQAWAPGLFVPALAALHLVLLPGAALEHRLGQKLAWLPIALLGVAGLLLALTMPEPATRAAVLLLAPVTLVCAAREPRLARLPWVAATLFLLMVALWGLPPWMPTGEAVTAGGDLLAILPGDWTPDALRPFLLTTAGMALLFAAAGLAGERRLPRPLPWASLPAAVPVLALALAYARVRHFQPDATWSAIALLLAAGLTGAAALAARVGAGQGAGAMQRAGAVQRAGVHAAGATAALSLGFAALLSGQWLTMALVLPLPALIWIEGQASLPPLRRVALAVAGVALVRLLLNDALLDEAAGQPALLNGRALSYLVAAAAFFVTARMARRRADDRLVAVLEVGTAAFVTALVALEIRQWTTAGHIRGGDLSFLEAGLQVSSLAVLGCISLWLDARAGRAALRWAWRVQGGLALLGGVALLVANPMLNDGIAVGRLPVLNALLPAYLLPGVLAGVATRSIRLGQKLRHVLSAYAFLAAFAWVTLAVRQVAHPDAMGLDASPVLEGELWAWSGAWMAMAVGLMAAGLWANRRALRLAALGLMALVTAKVFLVDMAGLTGLWRVLSFLGLGLTLIGLGALYRRFVVRPVEPELVPPA